MFLLRAFLAVAILVVACHPCRAGEFPTSKAPLVVDSQAGTLSFLAEVNPSMADAALQHFVVWKDGEYADKALFKGYVSPREFHAGLVSLGFVPGNNMTMENWDHERVQGEKLRVTVRFAIPGGYSAPVDMADVVRDAGGRGLDMRFGGNLATAEVSGASGCLICLFSCPMGIVSNHATFFKETGWWGKVKYRAQGLPQGERTAVITMGRR